MGEEIKYSVNEGIGILVINRPEARNALNWAAQMQFAEIVREAMNAFLEKRNTQFDLG